MGVVLNEAYDQQRALYMPRGVGTCQEFQMTSQDFEKAMECRARGGHGCGKKMF